MNQNKEYYKKCLICGSKDWIERDDDEDGHSIVCNMCGFAYSK
jgi:DNA-directed RNA polymerase subunit RPC12/RpoP